MYCSKCGTKLSENSLFCSECGASVNEVSNSQSASVKKESNDVFGWGVLGFFIPIAGLILYLIWKEERPNASKAAGLGALICVILNVAICILFFLIFFIALAANV